MTPATRSRLVTLMLLAGSVVAGVAHGAASMGQATTRVAGGDAELDVTFVYDASKHALDARYTLRNTGAGPLASFDRGTSLEVKGGRLPAGAVPAPAFQHDGDATTFSHVALALPKPAPTVPRIPLAARVEPGASLEGAFRAEVPSAAKRVRWCLGVLAFDEATFSRPIESAKPVVWHAAFDAASRQRELCTPWFDVATSTFATD